MSEGKLKTEIDKLLEDGANMQYTIMACKNNAEFAGVLRVGIKPSVDILLDAANKEFPTVIDAKDTAKSILMREVKLEDINRFHLILIEGWRKKWFGE